MAGMSNGCVWEMKKKVMREERRATKKSGMMAEHSKRVTREWNGGMSEGKEKPRSVQAARRVGGKCKKGMRERREERDKRQSGEEEGNEWL